MPTDTPTIYNKVLMSPSPFSLLFTKLFQFLLDKIKVINSFLFILRTVVFLSPFPYPIEIKLQPFRGQITNFYLRFSRRLFIIL